jgi:hypothetical protein
VTHRFLILFGSKNASVEGRVLVEEERLDEGTRAKRLAQGMENQKLALKAVRLPLRRGSPRRAL